MPVIDEIGPSSKLKDVISAVSKEKNLDKHSVHKTWFTQNGFGLGNPK